MLSKKEKKRLYDIEYRKKNKEKLKRKKAEYLKKDYSENPDKYKKRREKYRDNGYTNNYNKKPEQRLKEKHRRYKRIFGDNWRKQTKECLICLERKFVIHFEFYSVFPDNRLYICKCCEEKQKKDYQITTRGTMTAMVMRRYTNLTREDIAKHPNLIEANKLLILIKRELL